MVQFLSSSRDEAKDQLVYKSKNMEDVNYNRGLIEGLEMFLELPETLDRYKEVDEAQKAKIKARVSKNDVYQAVAEGKTHFPSKEELGL